MFTVPSLMHSGIRLIRGGGGGYRPVSDLLVLARSSPVLCFIHTPEKLFGEEKISESLIKNNNKNQSSYF